MHNKFADYPHLYSANFFNPKQKIIRKASFLEQTIYWSGLMTFLLLLPFTLCFNIYSFNEKKMKILALGGSGGMGRYAVRSLYNVKQIDKIYIADVNALSAIEFASNFDTRVEGFGLDIRNYELLKMEMLKLI